MQYTQFVVRLSAALYIVMGVSFLFMPTFMCEQVGIKLETTTAMTEVRTFYGGFEIGIGAFLLISSFRRLTLRPAVVAMCCGLLGSVLARIGGIAMDGSPTTMTWILLVVEILWLGLVINAFVFLWRDAD